MYSSAMLGAMRYLGVDYGKKRIGLALSDEGGAMAFPKAVLENGREAVSAIVTLIQEEGVGTVVVGESKDLSGQANPLMKDIEAFIARLGAETGIPIVLEPEFMTSAQAARPPQKEGKSRSPKTRPVVDASAAALILQSFLDKMNR